MQSATNSVVSILVGIAEFEFIAASAFMIDKILSIRVLNMANHF